jgi:hypothetical protein
MTAMADLASPQRGAGTARRAFPGQNNLTAALVKEQA